nr:hypothetical protein [Tanacetum cinerariifolium]
MGDEDLNTISEKESDEVIKSSVEDLVPIPSDSEDTTDSKYDLPFCDNSMTFSNPFFDLNEDFTSSDDESLSDEDVPEDKVKIYSNPLFEFNDEYISSDVNPLFDEVLENIKNKDSYDSNLDELDLLVTPLMDANEDECFDPGGDIDEINAFLDIDTSTDIKDGYHDSEGDIIDFKSFLSDDITPNSPSEESIIPLNEIVSKIPPSIVITTSPPVLLFQELEDSLIMGDDDLNTIHEKETDEVIKSSVDDLVPIPSESEDTSGSDSEYDLSSCDDFSPIDIPKGKSMTFFNPLFDSYDDFTSSDDESLSDEDVPKDNVKIYLNSLFEFNDKYISSDVNPLFDEVLDNIENKDSYLNETDLLVTPLSDANEDECLDPGGDIDEIELLLHHDLSTLKMSVASIFECSPMNRLSKIMMVYLI